MIGSKRIRIMSSFRGILDELGNSNNAKFIYSPYKRLTKNFTDELVQVRRSSDFTSRWFGYDKNGDVEKTEMLNWVGAGNDGLLRQTNNQSNINYPIQQLLTASEPKIIDTGVFIEDGPLFDGSDDYLTISDYSDIQFTTYPYSFFSKSSNSVSVGYVFAKNLDSSSTMQYGLYLITNSMRHVLENSTRSACDFTTGCYILSWQGIESNQLLARTDDGIDLDTLNVILTNRVNIDIGCRSNNSDNSVQVEFFTGNIKTIIIFNSDEYSNYSYLSNNL